jgi:hypothetical protein
MIFASKNTLSLNNLKILRPKVMKNIKNLRKRFCEFPPRFLILGTSLRLLFPSISASENEQGYALCMVIHYSFFEIFNVEILFNIMLQDIVFVFCSTARVIKDVFCLF